VLIAVRYNNMDLAKAFGGLSAGLQAVREPLEVFFVAADE
jgi:hypothetical protein